MDNVSPLRRGIMPPVWGNANVTHRAMLRQYNLSEHYGRRNQAVNCYDVAVFWLVKLDRAMRNVLLANANHRGEDVYDCERNRC
jgi:hypothetical protein